VILICVSVRGFSVYLTRTSGFPAETGSGSFGVGADGLVIGVGFGVFGLVIGVGFGVSGLFQCFWVVSCFWVSMGSLVRLKCWIVDGGNRS
jgi:hypothetical protein